MTAAGYWDQSYPPSLWDTGPEPPPLATSAVAGAPGTWQPAGSLVPNDIEHLAGAAPPITAVPATTWTVGQHVILGDASHAHWSGTAWVAGNAPVVVEEEPAAAEEPPA